MKITKNNLIALTLLPVVIDYIKAENTTMVGTTVVWMVFIVLITKIKD